MKLENVNIPSGNGFLAGLHYIPEGNRRSIALVFAHGFTSGKYSMDHLAGYLAMHGYQGLSFDFDGHKLGGSTQELYSMKQAAGNLRAALEWIRGLEEIERIVLVGHSMGAAAALQTAADERADRASRAEGCAPLAGIVCICMGVDPAHGFETALGQAMLAQRIDYVAGAPALQLLLELDGLIASASDIGPLPALFIAARQDVLISVARVEQLAAVVPDSRVQIIESSHLEAPDKSRAVIFQWLRTAI